MPIIFIIQFVFVGAVMITIHEKALLRLIMYSFIRPGEGIHELK